MKPVFVISAARTPIGKFGGSFAAMSPADLGEVAARAALERSGLPAAAVDETVFGHARQAGGGPNTARQVSHRAGIPDAVPAYTVNKACASSLKALTLGALSIAAGENEIVLAGGTVHVRDPVPPAARPLRPEDGTRRGRRRDVPRRVSLPAVRSAHGRDGGEPGPRIRHPAGGAGRIRGGAQARADAPRGKGASATRSCP